MKRITFLPLLFLVCCVTEDNSYDKIGKLWCERQEECNRADFEREYRDMSDCRDDFYDTWNPVQECQIDEGCEYDPGAVSDCRQRLRTDSCEDFDRGEWTEDCGDAYRCSNAETVAVAICVARSR